MAAQPPAGGEKSKIPYFRGVEGGGSSKTLCVGRQRGDPSWRGVNERPAQAPSNSSSSSPTSPGATASLAGAGSAAPSAPAFDRAGRPVQTADDLAGEIARLGAVTAELSAAEPLRALLLVERYLAENVSPDAAAKLEALRAEADRDLAEAALRMPPVRPVKCVLQETA